jgi:hypothetical protein
MVIGRNGWFCTDPDCLQFCKKHSETQFEFVQAVWLDTCDGDTRAENANDESDNYAVCAGFIDFDFYDEEDIKCSINSYGYTMHSVREIYGEDANQIIAECLFENHCLYDSSSIAGVVSWEDAKETIQNYIDIK